MVYAISLCRVLLGVLGSDHAGTLNQRFRLRVFTLGEIEIRQAAEAGGHGQVLRP